MDYYAIGQRIRRIRKARGLSQEQLAEKIGISLPHMSHIETANTKMSLQVFADIAEALEVSADMLLHDEIPRSTTESSQEMAEILDSCTAAQTKILLEIAKASKQALDTYQ